MRKKAKANPGDSHLSVIERAVLIGVLADLERWRAADWHGGDHLGGLASGRWRIDWRAAREEGLVRLAPSSWLGRALTPTTVKRLSRAYAALEAAGLIERLAMHGGRTTHLRLTEAGTIEARRLTATEAATSPS
jgi:hypothetical protein